MLSCEVLSEETNVSVFGIVPLAQRKQDRVKNRFGFHIFKCALELVAYLLSGCQCLKREKREEFFSPVTVCVSGELSVDFTAWCCADSESSEPLFHLTQPLVQDWELCLKLLFLSEDVFDHSASLVLL